MLFPRFQFGGPVRSMQKSFEEVAIMVAEPRQKPMSREEYLERERKAETKSEYDAGCITAMAGASFEHNLITLNVASELRAELRHGPCAVVMGDLRVRVEECDTYFYPDVVVVCGEPNFEGSNPDTLLNPTVLIEVLSPSTEATDRGRKFTCYRALETVSDYLLISQQEPLVEHYTRQSEQSWLLTVTRGLDARLSLDTLGCTLNMADLYSRVSFPPPPASEPEANESAE